ncbi:hypothetical protein ACJX0J_015883, partial [Zea mays]
FVYMYTNKFEQKGIRKKPFERLASMASDNIIYFICILDTFLLIMDRNNLLSGLRTICFNHLGELCNIFNIVRKIGGHRITLVDIGQWFYFSVIGLIPCVDFQIRDNEVNIEDGMLADENSFTVHATISIIAVLFSSTFLANTTKYGQQVKVNMSYTDVVDFADFVAVFHVLFCFHSEHRSSPQVTHTVSSEIH